VLSDIAQLQDISPTPIQGALSWEEEAKFIKGVERSRDYIVAGDVFQVNLSRQWQYELTSDIKPTQVYQALKQSNPAPFAALANFESFSIISSSPLDGCRRNILQLCYI
jgi:anthranilate synthase component 1